MNTVTTRVGRITPQRPPSQTSATALRRTPRVALIDRLALRLGIALVVWSRRRGVLDEREERGRRVQNARATERRERAAQCSMLNLFPIR